MGVAAADACVDSLGGALSILSAYELAHKHPTRKVTLVTFGSPRAVNKPMADELLKALIASDNMQITGHQAFLTNEALGQIVGTTMANLQTFRDGADSKNEVKPPPS